MDVINGVTVVKSAPNDELYTRLIEYIDHTKGVQGSTFSGTNLDVRNVLLQEIFPSVGITQTILTKLVEAEISKYFYVHKAKFPYCRPQKGHEMQILKYEVGGKYNVHTDAFHRHPREVSVILNLNEGYEGGDFEFYHPNGKEVLQTVKQEKGTLIYFPSNFMYPHSVTPITKGTRYSVITWLA